LPVGAASQDMAGSNQIASEPRRLSASLQGGQFLVVQSESVGLPISVRRAYSHSIVPGGFEVMS
jgi:hypothetical protein